MGESCDKVKQGVRLFEPFAVPALLEVLTILFSFAWGASRVPAAAEKPARAKATGSSGEGEKKPERKPDNVAAFPRPRGPALGARGHHRRSRRAAGHVRGRRRSGDELRTRPAHGRLEGTASKKVSKAVLAGLATKEKVGREVSIRFLN